MVRQVRPRCVHRLTWPCRFLHQDHDELSRKMQRDKFRVPNVNWEPQIVILKKVGRRRDPSAQAKRSGGLTLTQALTGQRGRDEPLGRRCEARKVGHNHRVPPACASADWYSSAHLPRMSRRAPIITLSNQKDLDKPHQKAHLLA
jgi:hypothetical protein